MSGCEPPDEWLAFTSYPKIYVKIKPLANVYAEKLRPGTTLIVKGKQPTSYVLLDIVKNFQAV